MIESTRQQNALRALHAVVIRARFMAYKKESVTRIGELMDAADHLFTLLISEEDQTEKFRFVVADVASRFAVGMALEQFDADSKTHK